MTGTFFRHNTPRAKTWADEPGPFPMDRITPIALAALLAFVALLRAVGARAEEKPAFWAVTGVAAGDVLNLRDVPSAESKSLAHIPPHARGLRHLGCRRNQLPLEQWMRLSQTERQQAETLWCRVEYLGKQGWVAGRYLKRDDTTKH
jgi:hypothetical protein